MEKRKVGELLVDAEVITSVQLEIALAEQARTGRRLGRVLIDLGLATEESISRALASQTGVEHWGVARENRPFRAHVTLARAKAPSDTQGLLAQACFNQVNALLDEIRLYCSDLRPSGAVYRCLGSAKLIG